MKVNPRIIVGLALCGVVSVAAIGGIFTMHTHDDSMPKVPIADAQPAPPPPPSSWQECMDRAYDTGSVRGCNTCTEKIAKMMWHIAVCDRTFPEAATP